MCRAYLLVLNIFCLHQLCSGRRVTPSQLPFGSGNTSVVITDQLEAHHRRLASITANDHKVVDLPGLPEDVLDIAQYAGHLPLHDPRAGALFYWLFEAPGEKAKTAPLLIWLNGGPVRLEQWCLNYIYHMCIWLTSLSFYDDEGLLKHGWALPGVGAFQD